MWLPATAAVVFLAVSGTVMLNTARDAKDAILVNLRNTCYNSERFREHNEVQTTCWEEYERLGGKAAPTP